MTINKDFSKLINTLTLRVTSFSVAADQEIPSPSLSPNTNPTWLKAKSEETTLVSRKYCGVLCNLMFFRIPVLVQGGLRLFCNVREKFAL